MTPSLPPPPPGKPNTWPWSLGHPPPDPASAGLDWPRIGVVTPSFNQAEFLEETIRSVLGQHYPHLDYAVMDGGSTDGSLEVIRKYAPWLTHWVSAPDGGQSHAINAGFAQVGGDILTWLNSDDVLEPGALWHAARAFQAHSAAAVIFGNAEEIARDGTSLGLSQQVQPCDRDFLVREYNGIVQPAAFFRRAAYAAVGGLDPNLNWALDYDLWIKLAGVGPLVYVPQTLGRTRLYRGAKTGSGHSGMFTEIRQVAERNGGQGLPRRFAQMLGEIRVPQFSAAVRQGDAAAGQPWLNEAVANVPEWRSEARLAELLAGEVWRRITVAGDDLGTALQLARQLCRALPATHVSPRAVERRVLGLLFEQLAFQCFQRGHTAAGVRYGLRALRHDWRRAANRGLWAVTLRALARR